MTADLTTVELLDEALPKLTQYKNPDCDPITMSDNSGVWVAAHLDFDYQQFLMLEVRKPYINPTTDTIVDNLFLWIKSYGNREFEWDNHPHEFFDTSEYMAPYERFIGWTGQMLDTDNWKVNA